VVCFVISQPNVAFAVQNGELKTGTLRIDLMSVGGERADYHGTSLKIYQDNSNVLFETIGSLSGNPCNISLPLGHSYKIELYVTSMYATVGYATVDNDNQELQLNIPATGSARLTVMYNDGITPINNATVSIRSGDGTYQYWTNSTTDESGNTIRFWLQPTILNNEYYVANILIGNDLTYRFPFNILPGTSNDAKVITSWPNELPPLTVSVYKSDYQKVSKSNGDFVVQVYDSSGNKVAESKVDVLGEAHFPGLKIGSYIFRASNSGDPENGQWETKTTLDGRQTSVQIFTNTSITVVPPWIPIPDPSGSSQIPLWVRNNAKWWGQNQISDSDFISAIKYLIQQGIIKMPAASATNPSSMEIPYWIKSNAAWWSQGQISDDAFIRGIQYLISNGIMKTI
jgi:hypothetical protein